MCANDLRQRALSTLTPVQCRETFKRSALYGIVVKTNKSVYVYSIELPHLLTRAQIKQAHFKTGESESAPGERCQNDEAEC